MKKMGKKLICFMLTFAMLLSSMPALAFSNNNTTSEVFYTSDGSRYVMTKVITKELSRAITKDSSNKVVADFTYYFDSDILKSNTTNEVVSLERLCSFELSASATEQYKYSYTDTGDFTFASYTVLVIATAIAASSGVAAAVITAIVEKAISDKLSGLYYQTKVYTYGDSTYFYIKRVTTIYSKDTDAVIGGPFTTYQKTKQK